PVINTVFELVFIVVSSVGFHLFVVSGEHNRIKLLCEKQYNVINTYANYAKVKNMDTVVGMRIFTRVAEAGSFSEAGRQLGVALLPVTIGCMKRK
ncbi:MAG: hypothetical protein ACE1Z4_11195, partial [Gammaproteobacteria bacterium]